MGGSLVKMRRFALLVLALVLFSSCLFAQKFGAEIGYSYLHMDLGGGQPAVNAYLGYELQPYLVISHHIAIEGDISGSYGALNNSALLPYDRVHNYLFLAGPAYVRTIGKRAVVQVHALGGEEHIDISRGLYKSTGWAVAGGGGLDYKILSKLYVRVFEADYVYSHLDLNTATGGFINSTVQNHMRIGAGITWLF